MHDKKYGTRIVRLPVQHALSLEEIEEKRKRHQEYLNRHQEHPKRSKFKNAMKKSVARASISEGDGLPTESVRAVMVKALKAALHYVEEFGLEINDSKLTAKAEETAAIIRAALAKTSWP